MRKAEVEKMERQEICYNHLLFRMTMYRERLEKVTLFRKKNAKGRLVSSFVCYLTNNESENIRTESFRLYDEEYLWFACALEQDFPETPFVDLTDEENKVVKNAV